MQTERRRPEADKAMGNAAATDEAAGWITWGGGECPVAENEKVEVRFRRGESVENIAAGFWMWEWVTDKSRRGGDIVAYRIVGAAA